MAATSKHLSVRSSRLSHAPSTSSPSEYVMSPPARALSQRVLSHAKLCSFNTSSRLTPLQPSLRRPSRSGSGRSRPLTVAAASSFEVDEDIDLQGESIAEDYYSVLGLKPEATQEEIKTAYYTCMKVCHPDLSGNHPDSVAFCSFVNEIYEVLSDPEMRAVYDEIKGYSLSAINPFFDTEAEREYAFVDEFTCIGCKNCANTAEGTFGIEDLFGRARVYNQQGDCPSRVQEAIDTCPVECIHWVSAAQLTLLEDEMRRIERVSVGIMMSGQGSKGVDVFRQANSRWDRRRRAAEEKARIRAMKEKRRQEANGETPWGWDTPWWGGEKKQEGAESKESTETEEERRDKQRRRPSKEQMAKAAEAARRWREYSQQGVDRKRRVMALADSKWEVGSGTGQDGPEGADMGLTDGQDPGVTGTVRSGDKELTGAGKM